MEMYLYFIFGIVVLTLVIVVACVLIPRRRSIPCPVWLAWLVEMDNPFTSTNRAVNIIERLEVQPGMAILDVGCGPGRLTIPIARQVGEQGRVVAVDIQEGMLDKVRQKAQAASLNNIHFLHAGVGDGKIEQGQFDRALLVTVLGEIPDPEAALKEIYEALKPGGILSITEILFDPHYQGRHTVTRLASAAGFREKAFYGNRIAYTLNLEKSMDS